MSAKDDKEALNLKDIRSTFYESRNFELSHLWQRSIFLTAFIVLLFTSYGFVLNQIVGSGNDKEVYIHIIACGVAVLGTLFSILWIRMGKASKAWYEVYEAAIKKIEAEERLNIDEDYRMGNLNTKDKLNNNLFSTTAGAFSVSKINIAIGQIFLVTWLVILLIHFCILLVNAIIEINHFSSYGDDSFRTSFYSCIGYIVSTFFVVVLIILALFAAFNKKWMGSNFLAKK